MLVNTLAIIPARGGSKGVPRKNLRYLCGMPLVAWSIEAARRSTAVTRVVVSTDDHEISTVARRYGAEVVMRPPELASDTATSESALLHVLEHLRRAESYSPDLVVFLQCTSPLTLPEDIDGTVGTLIQHQADTCLSVVPFHHFLWSADSPEGATGINHDKSVRLRRQDMQPQYLETGAIYVMRTEGFLKTKHRFFGKTVIYTMPKERHVDIDDPVDFRIAELLLREHMEREQVKLLPSPVEALVLDFDGVFTDNHVIVYENGMEAVVCSRSDGMGIAALRNLNIPVIVISTERNPVVDARCRKLGVPVIQGVDAKLAALRDWAGRHHIDLRNVVYVGNDVNDIACMQAVGCGIAVRDCHPDVSPYARIVLSSSGGDGAIREVVDLISKSMKGER